MKTVLPVLLASTLASSSPAAAQSVAPKVVTLSATDFEALAARCVPRAPLATLRSLVEVQSRFNPLAVNINYPEAAARQLGLGEGTVALTRQPQDVADAAKWSRWFLSNGQTISVGLTQLNIEHLATRGISLEDAFDTCTNLRVGWSIFDEKYKQAAKILGPGQLAMQTALSAYNSGTLFGGFRNGYVDDILRRQLAQAQTAAETAPPASPPPAMNENPLVLPSATPPDAESKSSRQTLPANPRTADTAIPWDVTRAATPWPLTRNE